MILRIPLKIVVALGLVCAVSFSRVSRATDVFWDGGAGTTNWATGTNWVDVGEGQNVPEAQYGERAVLGTDDSLGTSSLGGQLAANAVISGAVPPIGGIALGYRERAGGIGALLNPAPAAGALTGTLTISSGTVNSRRSPGFGSGADGRVLVGFDGRGYLNMTGGRLNAVQLAVAGEQVTTGAGLSAVNLSGNARIEISNAQNATPAEQVNDAALNTATFSRNLVITGPDVIFNSFGRLTLNSTNSYTANITSPTLHSALRTNNIAVVSGSLAVNFSGAGASGHAFGETWDLVDSPLAIAGNFTNLNSSGEVAVAGLTTPNPLGTTYRVQKVSDGTGQTLQLVYDRLLVLRVNRDTGELTVRNPHGGPIQIDGYTVSSSLGSMLASYSGISGQVSPPDSGWFKPVDGSAQPLNTVNTLTEIKSATFGGGGGNPTYNLTSVPSFTIGNGFSRTAVGSDVNNFGTDGEDLTFSYSVPGVGGEDGRIVFGHIEYVGTKFENNMVLRVNPTTGQAFLKNDSLETLKFDGYSITSTTGSLVGGTWTGLSAGSGWQKSPLTTTALSQTNPTSSLTLAPGAEAAIGDIGAFTTQAQQDGLALKFILSEGLVDAGGLTPGDFDADGDVDGRDFLTWQRNTSVGALSDWQANYGSTGGGGVNPPETTFRIGSVVFDPTAGVAAATAVPEPSTALLALSMFAAVVSVGRNRTCRCSQSNLASCKVSLKIDPSGVDPHRGAQVMTGRMGWCALVLGLCFVSSASAVTQGIPLVNGDFELPGPAGTKVVAFNETGVPFAPTDPVVTLPEGGLAGGIPGWTFTGGDGGLGEACPGSGLGCELFGDEVPGDSGTEAKPTGFAGNEMILSTVDGKVFQTSVFSLPAAPLPATQKLLLSFDVHNIYTPTGQGQLTAWLYYINGSGNRVTIGTPSNFGPLGAYQDAVIEFVGGSAALTPALGRPIGVAFDTTSRELDALVVESWAGVDNVLLEIAGTLPGDFNGDGSINLTDYAVIRDNLEEAHTYLFEGDIVRDGIVDLADFRAWKSLPSVINSGVLAEIAAIPEPSSMMLILVSTIAGAFSRRRFGISDRLAAMLLAIVGTVFVTANATPASAALLYYDPILVGSNPAAGEYTLGTLGTVVGPGQNPIVGPYMTGAWDIQATDATLGGTSAQATGLSFLGAPAAGGSLIANGSSRAFRSLATPFDATTNGTYYISFLANFGGVGVDPNSNDANAVGHRNVELLQVGGNEGSNFRVGYATYNGNFAGLPPAQAPLKFGPFGQEVLIAGAPTSFATDNGTTHLIVLKFTFSDQAASDSIELFLNPRENEQPVVADAAFFNRDITLDRISGPVQFGGAGTSMQLDELRIADTFEDALPEFPRKGNTNPDIDDFVDILDYNAIISNMNRTGMTTAQGDVTGDGKVDLLDLRVWRDNRTDIPALGAIGDITVPEPTSAALALLASMGLLGLRGRRA
jgi:hypothetical protein